MKIIQESKINIKEVITALKNGAVLVLPTDTVYGLVCDATNKKAVEKIYKIKKRDKSKPLPVFVKNIEMAKEYAVIRKDQEEFLKNKWPGATTVVLGSKDGLSPLVYKDNTVALRQPNYKLILKIIGLFKKPLAQTSANISNKPSTTIINDIVLDFKNADVIIFDAGNLPKSKPSTIIDLTSDKIKIIRK